MLPGGISHSFGYTRDFFRVVRDIWGTLCSSLKQIKAPYLFDWEQGISLHAMQGNWASSLREREVSLFLSSCGGNLGYVLELGGGSH